MPKWNKMNMEEQAEWLQSRIANPLYKKLKKEKHPWVLLIGAPDGKFHLLSNLSGKNPKDNIGRIKIIMHYLIAIAASLRAMILATYLSHDNSQN